MSLYTLIIVTFVIFMAINVIIGLRGRKHASTTKDFLTASGQSGIWFIIGSAVGASIGSGVVIGTTQYAVKLGVAGAYRSLGDAPLDTLAAYGQSVRKSVLPRILPDWAGSTLHTYCM